MNIEQIIPKNELISDNNWDYIFQYRFHKQYPVYQNQWCFTFAFNKNSSNLAIGCNEIIKLYEFNKGDLKQFKYAQGHNFDVRCLEWFNLSNQLISAGHDGKIVFWPISSTSQQKFLMKLATHSLPIYCLITNAKEDILISGGIDQKIKILNLNYQKSEWNCLQVIDEHKDTIFALSLSQNQTKLISCGYDNLILVLESNTKVIQKTCWVIKQKIITDVHGYRLCFLKDYLFTFQPFNKEELWIYDDRNPQNKFIKSDIIESKSGCEDFANQFPQQFIQDKRILLSKNGNYIHLIKVLDQDKFQLKQSIDFGDQCIFGLLSTNGDYLVTWDNKSKSIQIRMLEEKV